MNFPKAYADQVAKLRVPSGFLLVAAFAWFSHPSTESLLYGIPVSLLGLGLRAWAAGHLAKNQKLTTSGPYRFLRHPNYAVVSGEIAVVPLALGLPLYALVFTVLNAAVLAVRITAENAALASPPP